MPVLQLGDFLVLAQALRIKTKQSKINILFIVLNYISSSFFIETKVEKKSGWEDDNLLEITPLIVNRIVNSRFQRINVQIYTIYL